MRTRLALKTRLAAGYAMLLTLTFLGIVLIGFASIMHWVSSNAMVTARNNLYVSAQAAAESATENVITAMMRDFTYNTLKSAASYQDLIPNTNGWPVLFKFADTNGSPNQSSVEIGDASWSPLPSQFQGLYGYGHDCVIAATATTVGKNYDISSTVSQSVWFGNIPLFQFAIFYNMQMEINPGAAMTVNGRVHSNYNIYATGSSSGSPLKFGASVDATGFATNKPSPLDPQNPGRSGNTIYADTNSPISNADSLTLPIGTDGNNNPTNITSMLSLPPDNMIAPQSSAYSTNGQVYLYNEADLIVSNSAAGVNGNSTTNALTVFYQNPNSISPLTPVAPDVKVVATGYVTNIVSGHNVVTSTLVTNYYYSFVTNQTFYDYREGKTVQAVQVDVGNLNTWLANNSSTGGLQFDQLNTTGSTEKGHGINSIYVQSEVDVSGSTLPAVRVTDGAKLPSSGLTVATALPLYVKGDYNITDASGTSKTLGDTTHTKPAALIGDAITVLSANWQDSWNASTSLGSRTPASICINAATLEGIVPSNGSHYSGGVENFLRLLENWSGKTVTYNGSIVVMFPSQYATSPWSYGSYYTAPNRQWGFDLNFQDSSKLPPLTPQVRATIRAAYATR